MFQRARLKLTAWYLLIIMFISLCFSLVIYRIIGSEIIRITQVQRFRIERGFGPIIYKLPPAVDVDIINESRHRLLLTLIVINGSIFAVTGILGYFLAGRTLSPIRQMLDEQNRFISDSSHELRTPLTSLKSAFEVNLRDKKLTLSTARQLIAESILEVDKLKSLTDGLLQLTQYQKPNSHTQFKDLSLAATIDQSLKNIAPIAKIKNITLVNTVNDAALYGDPHGLVDLFTIIIDNAVKYSPSGKTITISSRHQDNSVLVSVKDRGIGISKKDLPHIFDRFYRANTARTKTSAGGFGLGLSIAKKIADLHRAQINVTSLLGKGTTFTIKFPLSRFFS